MTLFEKTRLFYTCRSYVLSLKYRGKWVKDVNHNRAVYCNSKHTASQVMIENVSVSAKLF